MIIKNITDAMQAHRNGDTVLKVLSNKYAITQSAFTNGKFDKPSIKGLCNGKIYHFGYVKDIPLLAKQASKMPNYDRIMIFKIINGRNIGLVKTTLNRKYKANYRKIESLLK